MNDDTGMIIIIAVVICLIIAEIFGRSKHIGRWWTFFLLLSGLIPGIIAVLVSPSAKKKPTPGGKSYVIWGWICLLLGVGNTITLIGSKGQTGQLFFAFLILSYYLFELSKGHIINKEPKYYFDNLRFNSSTFSNESTSNLDTSGNYSHDSDDVKNNLKKLKDSGLLTQFEYLNKLKMIEAEKGQNILKSDGYLKLKQLYDTGVLSTAEFYSKLQLLENSVAPILPRKKKNTNQIYYLIGCILILIAIPINWNEAIGGLKDFMGRSITDTSTIDSPENDAQEIVVMDTIASVQPEVNKILNKLESQIKFDSDINSDVLLTSENSISYNFMNCNFKLPNSLRLTKNNDESNNSQVIYNDKRGFFSLMISVGNLDSQYLHSNINEVVTDLENFAIKQNEINKKNFEDFELNNYSRGNIGNVSAIKLQQSSTEISPSGFLMNIENYNLFYGSYYYNIVIISHSGSVKHILGSRKVVENISFDL